MTIYFAFMAGINAVLLTIAIDPPHMILNAVTCGTALCMAVATR